MAGAALPLARHTLVAHVRLILGALLLASAAAAQTGADPNRFRQAGVCSRCHVAPVLEWSTSQHPAASVSCQSCHGASAGHVTDERNNVKPDRVPHGAAIAGLCQTCHSQGCPKTSRRDACETCHDIHALFNPNENKQLSSVRFAEDDRLKQFEVHVQQGEAAAKAQQWAKARDEFGAALRLYPRHPAVSARLDAAKRRLQPAMPGFEVVGDRYDPGTGLPLKVRVQGLAVEMVLMPGGDADLGDESLRVARPIHTVSLEPFYLATTELTQRTWTALGADNPSTHRGDELPVHNISWNDAQQGIARVNQRVPGGGFRLPTEAEWEFAARSGAESSVLAESAWFRANSAPPAAGSGFRELDVYAPHAVATRRADARGIYDLRGNVWEWCSSLMRPYPYEAEDGRESADAAGLRVLRGGGYADSEGYLAPYFRHAERPDRRQPFNGLRLARSVPPL